MAKLRLLFSGALLAGANVYSAISNLLVISIVFNSVDLKTFGAISVVLTSLVIFQTIFNTQSWQGLLHSDIPLSGKLLRKCLAIDFGVAAIGGFSLMLAQLTFLPALSSDIATPNELLWIFLNVVLMPPGTLIAVIRKNSRFVYQALIDILAGSVKIIMAFFWVRGSSDLLLLVMTLVIPEFIRWCGYLIISLPQLKRYSVPESSKEPSSRGSLRAIYTFSFWGMLTEISHLPTAQIDKLLVGALLGLESLAIWDVIKRWVMAMVQITTVANQMLFPHFVRSRGKYSIFELERQCFRHCLMLGGFVLLVYTGMATTLPFWFPFIFHIDQATWSMLYLQQLFGLLALVMTFVLGATPIHALFLALRHSSQSFGITIVGNLIFFVLSYVLLPMLGLFGAPLAIFGSDLFIILAKIYLLRLTTSPRDGVVRT